MDIKINMDGNIIIDNIYKSELDLDKTLDCGQAFRWKKETYDKYLHRWIGVVNNKIWILQQYENCIITNLKEEDKEQLIYYFNLDMNYTDVLSRLELDKFALKAYEYSKGIHILRQDLFETIVTFLMSQCNTMHNIKNIINKLCTSYGDKITTNWNKVEYTDYTFPTLEKLNSLSISELMQCSMGFRADYLKTTCEILSNNTEILCYLKTLQSNTAVIRELTQFKGIGNKVANCISLFGLHHIEAFPIDTHIKQIIDSEYNGYLDISNYKSYAGIIQQYMFYYKAFNK